MKRVLYTKTNRLRNPVFQTATAIVDDQGTKSVCKWNLRESGKHFIEAFPAKKALYDSLYKNVSACDANVEDGKVYFPFVDGETAVVHIVELMNSRDTECSEVLEAMKQEMSVIFEFNDEAKCEFEASDEFVEIFGDEAAFLAGEPAVKGGDVDAIFDNFVITDDGYVCIDYEWTFDLVMPVDLMRFRCLYYFYYNNYSYFKDKISIVDYLGFFGIEESVIGEYQKLDDGFQQYVHGTDRKYMYEQRYRKKSISMAAIIDRLSASGEGVEYIERLDETIKHYKDELDFRQKLMEERLEIIRQKEAEIAQKEAEIAEKNTIAAGKDFVIARKNAEMASLVAIYNEITGSKSWKLTRPLRKSTKMSKAVLDAREGIKAKPAVAGVDRVVSFAVVVHTAGVYTKECVDSFLAQTYDNFTLFLIPDGEIRVDYVNDRVSEYSNPKVKVYNRDEAFSSDFIVRVNDRVVAAENMLECIAAYIKANPGTEFVYGDEDEYYIRIDGRRDIGNTNLKSDFNLDLMRSTNYIGGVGAIKTDCIKSTPHTEGWDESSIYEMALSCAKKPESVGHISGVLYHVLTDMLERDDLIAARFDEYQARYDIICNHLSENGIEARVNPTEYQGCYDVEYPLISDALVSIVIPNKDEKDTLKKCIDSVLERTDYPNYEVIVVENNSTTEEIFEYYKEIEAKGVQVVTWEDEFNYSAINNFGVGFAKGEYIILLNNDIEVIEPSWMRKMLTNCMREEVGIVGAKLLYPNDTIQHAGVILNMGGVAGHAFHTRGKDDPCYFNRAVVQQDYSAVTAACLMVKKSIFDEVGGLDTGLRVAYNDVDFCLAVRDAGYLVVYAPKVLMYHYESISRGADTSPEKLARMNSEADFLRNKWPNVLDKADIYYNKYLSKTAPYVVEQDRV